MQQFRNNLHTTSRTTSPMDCLEQNPTNKVASTFPSDQISVNSQKTFRQIQHSEDLDGEADNPLWLQESSLPTNYTRRPSIYGLEASTTYMDQMAALTCQVEALQNETKSLREVVDEESLAFDSLSYQLATIENSARWVQIQVRRSKLIGKLYEQHRSVSSTLKLKREALIQAQSPEDAYLGMARRLTQLTTSGEESTEEKQQLMRQENNS